MGNVGDLDHMEDKKSVIDFFSIDDISRQGPGKRDVVKIKLDDGSKIAKQKQHLVVSVMKAYNYGSQKIHHEK